MDAAWKGILLLAAVWVTTKLMKRASASTRHFVWVAAIAGVLALPILSAALPKWHVLPEWLQSITLKQAPNGRTASSGNGFVGMERHGVTYGFDEHRNTVSANDIAIQPKTNVDNAARTTRSTVCSKYDLMRALL